MNDEIPIGLNFEEIQQFDRNEAISNLLVASMYNSTEQFKTIIFSKEGHDINKILENRSEINEEIFEQLQNANSNLSRESWTRALTIAKTYQDNPDLRVPDRVIHEIYGYADESQINPEEKVLIITGHIGRHDSNDALTFTGERKHQRLKRPDVYLGSVEGEKRHDRDETGRFDFTIEGCDNIIIGPDTCDEDKKKDAYGVLSGKGKCIILPHADLSLQGLYLHVADDIMQYPGSTISLSDAKCDRYFFLGGEIKSRTHLPIEIHCREFVYGKGVAELDPAFVRISGDVDYVNRETELAAQIIRNQSGMGAGIEFNDHYPNYEEVATEMGITRSYQSISLEDFPTFFTTAIAQGWTIDAKQVEEGMSVTLTQKK
ncbi:MAG TPA: hypothetical protein VNW29_06040 [Candidatus Sulfotelmatobacter sp.]|jgi:hypothetical protein|nr:hypothetical protein [Candidatus Sulfotelmatobacter sp.]